MLSDDTPKCHLLTVALEDYFQVGAFRGMISRRQWDRFENRLEVTTHRVLALLDRYKLRATFFVLGWIAERYPDLVRRIAEQGHEIASKGFYHRGIPQMSPQEFRDDLVQSREVLEWVSGQKVFGYRLAEGWLRPDDLWALDSIKDSGYVYDSSICPLGRQFAQEPWRRFVHQHSARGGPIWEFPISCAQFLGWNIPIAGGNYLRQLPQRMLRGAVSYWDRTYPHPFVFYFHTWELDPDQPRISASRWLTRLRHYRNLDRMQEFIEYYFQRYRFTSIADFLKLDTRLREPQLACRPSIDSSCLTPFLPKPRTPVTIVIPCYNEEQTLVYLRNTLNGVEQKLQGKYDVRFCLVDDGSEDQTWEVLHQQFAGKPNYQLMRHDRNRGVAAAVLTGIRAAQSEIVCSMDADCSYDPLELGQMIPLLTKDVDLVTASPYHPKGAVRNVPRWRLALSRGASWLYRRILRTQLHTYTSCFRVYRRSRLTSVHLRNEGFLGIVEMLAHLDQMGCKIVEYPATLEVRIMGRSKMKTLRTIVGHLRLMIRLWRERRGNRDSSSPLGPQPMPPEPVEEALASSAT